MQPVLFLLIIVFLTKFLNFVFSEGVMRLVSVVEIFAMSMSEWSGHWMCDRLSVTDINYLKSL
jgi:hypothetical protein